MTVSVGTLQLCLIMLIALTSSCAYMASTIHLPESHKVESEPQGPKVAIPIFIDHRSFTHRIGLKRDYIVEDAANVISDVDVNEWLSSELKMALATKGFQVVQTDTSAHTLRLQGETLRFFIEPVVARMSYQLEADVFVQVTASRADGLETERRYYEKATKPVDAPFHWYHSTSDYEEVLISAVRTLMSRIATDLVTLVSRYPGRKPEMEQ